jgi:hypothetical protein
MGNNTKKRRNQRKGTETTDLMTNEEEVTSLETTDGEQVDGRQKRSKKVEDVFDGM